MIDDPVWIRVTFLSLIMSDLNFRNSYENQTQKISKSVFVTNFPEDSTTRDLWKVCSDYGMVVDVFIPFKRSKSGKRFAFVRFIKRGSQSHVTPEITKPALVLDETCIKEFDYGMSLMGRAKDVSAIPNLPCIISKEGFQNVKLSYLGGMWVFFEFDSLASKEKFLDHSGIGSWVFLSKLGLLTLFCKIASLWGEYVEWKDVDLKSLSCKHLYLKNNMKVVINERQKVIIQGKVYWIYVKELDAWFPNFQDDLSSDGESQEGDVANKADNNESHVDRVLESSFMHENDIAHKDVNSCKKGEVASHSEDPFNIYGILDGQKKNVCSSYSDELKFPPGFTPDNNDQEKKVKENIKDTTQRVQSLSNKLNDHCSNRGFSSQRSMNSHSQKSKGFNSFVETTWKSLNIVEPNGLIRLKKKLQALKIAIKAWSKEANKRSNDRKINIQQNLSEVDKLIDQGKSNDEILIKRITLLNDLQELNNRNAMEISQKAKSDGLFKQFSPIQAPNICFDFTFPTRLSSDQVQDLECIVTYEEVKRSVWDCGTNKSPGLDGFFFEFYRKYWTTIDDDVFQAVRDFFLNGHFPRGCNSYFEALIPKIQDAKFVKDFRPIRLIGSVYKIIAKILANRLCVVLPYLI
nr:hypothetical protein [Tanacetum cinerariifolium]